MSNLTGAISFRNEPPEPITQVSLPSPFLYHEHAPGSPAGAASVRRKNAEAGCELVALAATKDVRHPTADTGRIFSMTLTVRLAEGTVAL